MPFVRYPSWRRRRLSAAWLERRVVSTPNRYASSTLCAAPVGHDAIKRNRIVLSSH
jgi:hypothetical protein